MIYDPKTAPVELPTRRKVTPTGRERATGFAVELREIQHEHHRDLGEGHAAKLAGTVGKHHARITNPVDLHVAQPVGLGLEELDACPGCHVDQFAAQHPPRSTITSIPSNCGSAGSGVAQAPAS